MKTQVDLLPWEFKRRMILRSQLKFWGVIWFLFAAGGAVLTCWAQSKIAGSEIRLEIFERKARPLRKIVSHNEAIEKQLAQSDRRQAMLRNLAQLQQPLQLVGIISESARRVEGAIQVRSLTLLPTEIDVVEKIAPPKRRRSSRPAATTKIVKMKAMKLSLSGVAIDDFALSRFVGGLRQAGVFTSVELGETQNIQLSAGPARSYSVECVY